MTARHISVTEGEAALDACFLPVEQVLQPWRRVDLQPEDARHLA